MVKYAAGQTGRIHILRHDHAMNGPHSRIALCGLGFYTKTHPYYHLMKSEIKEIPLAPDEMINVCRSCKRNYRGPSEIRGLEQD